MAKKKAMPKVSIGHATFRELIQAVADANKAQSVASAEYARIANKYQREYDRKEQRLYFAAQKAEARQAAFEDMRYEVEDKAKGYCGLADARYGMHGSKRAKPVPLDATRRLALAKELVRLFAVNEPYGKFFYCDKLFSAHTVSKDRRLKASKRIKRTHAGYSLKPAIDLPKSTLVLLGGIADKVTRDRPLATGHGFGGFRRFKSATRYLFYTVAR